MKKILFTLSLGLGIVGFNEGFAQKLAHITSAEIVTLLPETKNAEAELAAHKEKLESQYKTMVTEYQSKVKDFEGKQALMTDLIRQTKMQEIQDMEARIQKFETNSQENIQKKNEELYQGIIKKVKDAINAVAKEGGYTYVFDYNEQGGTLIYAEASHDITAKVKAKLGVK